MIMMMIRIHSTHREEAGLSVTMRGQYPGQMITHDDDDDDDNHSIRA